MKRSIVIIAAYLVCALAAAGDIRALIPPDYWDLLSRSGFRSFRTDNFISQRNAKAGYLLLGLLGNARLEADRVIFRADKLVFIYYEKEAELGSPHPFELYAEGNVVVAPGPRYPYKISVFLTADALYYDGRTLQGLAVNVTARAEGITSLTGPEVPGELALIARRLRFYGRVERIRPKAERAGVVFNYFAGKDITVSTCDLALPHWGLKCGKAEAIEEEGPERAYTIKTSGTFVEIGGRRILPLPPAVLSTRFFRSVPLRKIQIVNSRKYGYGVRTTWSLNRIPGSGELLSAIHRSTGVPVDMDGLVDPLSKRGVGLGVNTEYGRHPKRWEDGSWQNVKGDLRLYWVHDTGEDRKEDELFPGHPPAEWRSTDRFRLRGFHRMELPGIGTLDGEISHWRDRNFYKEFFENELYRERNPQNPETYLLFRRAFGSDVLFSTLFRPRVNDFQNYTERLPQATLELFPKRMPTPVGPTLEAQVQAANIRFRPDTFEEDTTESFRTGRYHAHGTAALPAGIGRYLRVRPFYEAAGTIYERRWQRHGGAERLVQKAGVTAGTHIWRNFRFPSNFLGTSVLRHVIVPRVSYVNAFFSSRDHDQFYQFDSIDALDKLEYLELAIGTYLLGLRKGLPPGARNAVRRLVELKARIFYYPKPGRDNLLGGEGGYPAKWSNLMLEGFADILQPYLGAGVEAEMDVNRGKGFVVLDPYLVVRWPGRFMLNMGNLFIARDRLLGIARSNYFWADAYWVISENYYAQAYFRYDFANDQVAQQYYGLARRFHCITVETGLEVDKGDNEVRWILRAYPTGSRRRVMP